MNDPKGSQLECVLFDLDGTLLDSGPDLYLALEALCQETDYQLPEYQQVAQGISRGVAGIFSDCFGLDPASKAFEQLRDRYLEHYKECLGKASVIYPGLIQTLEMLAKQQLPWGVVTSKNYRFAEPLMAKHQPLANYQVLIGGDCVSPGKPHPAPVLEACRRLAVAPKRTLFIGDALKDIHSGKDAGTQTIAAGWGYLRETDEIADWPATYHLNQSEQLQELLEKLIGLR